MRFDSLPSPGMLPQGVSLRNTAANAISGVQMVAAATPGGKTRGAFQLQTFFTACATALSALVDGSATAFASTTKTVVSGTLLRVAFPEVMDTSVIPDIGAFTAAGGGSISSVVWNVNGLSLEFTGTGLIAGTSIAYAAPATNALRDRAGNFVASGTRT